MHLDGGRLRLADGRWLSHRGFGDPGGTPILFMHGNMNSRLFQPSWAASEADAAAVGARVVAVERPGVGRSTAHPGRSYASGAADCAD